MRPAADTVGAAPTLASPVLSKVESSTAEGFLQITDLCKSFGDHAAVKGMNLSIKEGELVAFLGPSGCGKTTTLHMIAGFVEADSGTIHIDGKRVDQLPSRARGTAMVFQDYALFPHMTVFDNVAFGLRMRKESKARIRERVLGALEFVQLGRVADKYPRELSGGMKQRVALARAIVVEPRILLLDEPLSNLDAKLRKKLRVELREFHDRVGVTTVFVTHDLEEAFYLADRVAVMNDGKLEQFASPEELYTRPATGFVADFVGYGNLIEGELVAGRDGRGMFKADGLEIVTESAPERPVIGRYAVPPHRVRVVPADRGKPTADNVFEGVVRLGAYLGPTSNILVDVAGHRFQCDVPEANHAAARLERGADVWVAWDATAGGFVEH